MIRFLFQQKILLIFWKEHFKSFAECYLLKILYVSFSSGYKMSCYRRYALLWCSGSLFWKSLGLWWRIQMLLFFLAKSVFAVVIVENMCYKDSSYVVLTKRENLISFLFFEKRKLMWVGWNPSVLTHAWMIFSFLVFNCFMFYSTGIWIFRFVMWTELLFCSSSVSHWGGFAYG